MNGHDPIARSLSRHIGGHHRHLGGCCAAIACVTVAPAVMRFDTPTALVLAGSRGVPDPVALSEDVAHKALVRIGGSTMLGHVLAALREAGFVRLLVSTDIPDVVLLARRLGAEIAVPGASPSESVALAFRDTGAPLLVTTADHPLLCADWIRRLIAHTPEAADVSVMLARQSDVEAALPGSRRTWLRFADGGWSGCNLFLLATADATGALEVWQRVERERKEPWRLARRLGWRTLLDYAAGRLTMADAIGRLGRRAGVRGALVPTADGLAAIDVDTVDDLAMVRRLIEKSKEGHRIGRAARSPSVLGRGLAWPARVSDA